MFTGIIENIGEVIELRQTAGGLSLAVDVSRLGGTLTTGASLAVNGVCLSAVRPTSGMCYFDVIAETVRRTNFADLQVGRVVNLERSMLPDSRFDGHFVQGHVDAVATVDHVLATPQEQVLWFSHDGGIAPLVVPKGSIAVNGVSMTIAEVREDGAFSLAVIPTTLERTNLGRLQAGDRVNVETDILARTILHQMRTFLPKKDAGDLLSTMQRQGFA